MRKKDLAANAATAEGNSTMSTFTKLSYHIVFGTKYRRKLISDPFRKRLYEYIGGIIRAQNGHLIEVGGIEDHIHRRSGKREWLLFKMAREISF
jgi:hypothetical protein